MEHQDEKLVPLTLSIGSSEQCYGEYGTQELMVTHDQKRKMKDTQRKNANNMLYLQQAMEETMSTRIKGATTHAKKVGDIL